MKHLAAVNIGQSFLGNQVGKFQDINIVSSAVTVFLNIAFVVAGVILLFYFLLGGWGLISSAGKSDPKALEQAKASLTTGVLGLVIVILAYWIVQLILSLIGSPINI